MRTLAYSAFSLLLAGSAVADDCNYTAPHRLNAALGDATSIVIVAKAGELKVNGSRARDVTATGTACVSDRDLLSGIRLEARREGSELRIEAVIPEFIGFTFHRQAQLDFEVNVPDSLPVRIVDGSGETQVRDVASVDINDGSGEIRIRNVRGDVRVKDGSGSVEIDRVGGSVVIVDGSGSIDIRDVTRDVTIEADGSGCSSETRRSRDACARCPGSRSWCVNSLR